MARAYLFDIQVVSGHVQAFSLGNLLDDDLPNEVRAVAFDRYMQYQMMLMQQMAAMAGVQPGQPPSGPTPPPGAQAA